MNSDIGMSRRLPGLRRAVLAVCLACLSPTAGAQGFVRESDGLLRTLCAKFELRKTPERVIVAHEIA